MKTLNSLKFGAIALLIAAGTSRAAESTPNDKCIQTIASDAAAVSNDIAAIAAQAKAQGFNAAVAQFVVALQSIVPTLTPPSQQAVEKFILDLETAASPSSPDGTGISFGERLVLTNDWVILVTSTGINSAQLTAISDDFISALGTLKGISTAQLRSDFDVLVGETQACLAQL